MRFNPHKIVKEFEVTFFSMENKKTIDKDNWPENLIYDENLSDLDNVEEFYKYMWSDTTLTFYIESAINIVRSLISRAINYDPPDIIEHSDVHIIFLDDDPKENEQPGWMQKTKTVIYFRKKLLESLKD